MAEPGDYSVLDGGDNDILSVLVPQHDDTTRLSALRLMLDHLSFLEEDGMPEQAFQAELDALRPTRLARHTEVDRLEDCGCEDASWWCDSGGGPRSAAWEADRPRLVRFMEETHRD